MKREQPERTNGLYRRLLLGAVVLSLTALAGVLTPGCLKSDSPAVVVYAAQDQVFAEPIFKQFTAETGIKVRAAYDSEAVKTVGLANRLLAERSRPQCDVFWGNEELRTRQLAAHGIFRNTNGWAAFGFRSRRIVVNTNKLPAFSASTPLSLRDLTTTAYRGKVALAYPLFGTTSAHFLALRQHWGETNWLAWCRALQANKPFLVDGNSQVVKLVGRGEAWLGLTDSDDVAAGQNDARPIVALPITAETLLIPNTVAVVRGGPNPMWAQQLFQYLQRREVGDQLMMAQALEGWSPGLRPHLKVDWDKVLKDLEPATAQMKAIFLR
ncbi:MAG: extracellular solute-binding protein [Verrucomicrobia bacterium]|nr:extracellular solute-binding protein [Verrucomicrobiota bacterium]